MGVSPKQRQTVRGDLVLTACSGHQGAKGGVVHPLSAGDLVGKICDAQATQRP